jgi:hypothetical protein
MGWFDFYVSNFGSAILKMQSLSYIIQAKLLSYLEKCMDSLSLYFISCQNLSSSFDFFSFFMSYHSADGNLHHTSATHVAYLHTSSPWLWRDALTLPPPWSSIGGRPFTRSRFTQCAFSQKQCSTHSVTGELYLPCLTHFCNQNKDQRLQRGFWCRLWSVSAISVVLSVLFERSPAFRDYFTQCFKCLELCAKVQKVRLSKLTCDSQLNSAIINNVST